MIAEDFLLVEINRILTQRFSLLDSVLISFLSDLYLVHVFF